MSDARKVLLRASAAARVYPTGLFIREPFKIIEYQELIKLADLRPEEKILGVGCGSGLQTVMMANRYGSALGVDLDREADGGPLIFLLAWAKRAN